MGNVYDIVHRWPATASKRMPEKLEQLAVSLVKSGRMRIDAHEKINFIRFPHKGRVLMYSYRELHDPNIYPKTEAAIGRQNLDILRQAISTNMPVPEELELKLARLLVQSIDPVVIKLLLIEGTEVFISYSHNIGDLLDMESWRSHGSNSGMQSVDIAESRVFVSTDGDPFSEQKELKENAEYATTRFMVIAAQELGHYSDIVRVRSRYWRYSLMPDVNQARLQDLSWIKTITEIFDHIKLAEAAKLEKDVLFYKKQKKFFAYLISKLKATYARHRMIKASRIFKISVTKLHTAKNLAKMLADMKFNMHPKAPAYERDDPVEELAVVNIEALARVPQQVIKWGHETTKFMLPNMYKIYYQQVIPACHNALNGIGK